MLLPQRGNYEEDKKSANGIYFASRYRVAYSGPCDR